MSDQLAKFLSGLDWGKSLSDNEVNSLATKLKARVEQLQTDSEQKSKSEPAASTSSAPEATDVSGALRMKLVVVGDGAVGKTSLLISFSTSKFPTDYVPTVFENYTAHMKKDDQTILLHLWDTAGQEDYDRLRPLSYPGADIVLLCFALNNPASLDAIASKWHPEVDHYIPDVPTILVGTKLDLREEQVPDASMTKFEPVTSEMGQKMADKIKATAYMEVSSKTRKNLEGVFNKAVEIVMDARHIGKGGADKGKAVKRRGGCLMM